jgi:hypothetical protein
MKLLLFIVGFTVLAFICYLLYRMRVGHVVAVHLYRFETTYDKIFEETQSKELALKHSLIMFKECPILNRLTDVDYDQIVHILKDSPFPKKIINKMVLKTDTKTSLKALQSAELLTNMAAVGRTENKR